MICAAFVHASIASGTTAISSSDPSAFLRYSFARACDLSLNGGSVSLKRTARSTTGTTLPRTLMTPRSEGGIIGTLGTSFVWHIAQTVQRSNDLYLDLAARQTGTALGNANARVRWMTDIETAIHGLLLAGDSSTTILTGGHILRKCCKCS